MEDGRPVWSSEVDVIVAGAGGGGLAAALRCARAGLSVILADASKDPTATCTTSRSSGMIPGAGSRWQRDSGIEDSPEAFLDDIRTKTKNEFDEPLASALCDVSAELVRWLNDDAGVRLDLVTDFRYEDHSRNRLHAVPERSGQVFHRRLLDVVTAEDDVTLFSPARLVEVVPVAGGEGFTCVFDRDGRGTETLTARAVVLATCGFGANRQMVSRWLPEMASAVHGGSEFARGDAISIGEALGADFDYLDSYQGHGSFATVGESLSWASILFGGFLVNTAGRRFANESMGYSAFGRYTLEQPDGIAWAVLDRTVDENLRRNAHYKDIVEAGAVKWCDDIADVAAHIGAPLEAVQETFADVRQAARDQEADSVGRRHWHHALTAPFGLVRVTGALFHTQGGLKVDDRAQVMKSGSPIGGLYAVGGAASGISGRGATGYLPGNGLLCALGLGYLAGGDIARSLPACTVP